METKKEKGFTLIEMLVVIVIIGILATIVIVNVSGARRKAGAAKAKTTVNQLVTLFEQAASQGCKTVSVTSTTTGPANFFCGSASGTQLGTIDVPPTGFSYTITIGASSVAAAYNSSTGSSPWNGNSISSASINSDYTFSASDGFATATDVFNCSTSGGCKCSAVDGCN